MHANIRSQQRGRFRLFRFGPQSFIPALLTGLLVGFGVPVKAAEPATAEPSEQPESATVAPPLPAVIPVEQIATRATEAAHLLGTVTENLASGNEIETIRQDLPAVSAELTLEFQRTLSLLRAQPSLETLQTLTQFWQQRQLALNDWLVPLTERTTRLQHALERLSENQETWSRTRDAQRQAKAPATILQQIDSTLAAIEAMQPLIRTQRDVALEFQGKVAQEVVRCETARARIAQLQQGAVGGVLARDGSPIWSPHRWDKARAAVPSRFSQIIASYQEDMRAYIRDPAKHMPVHLGIFILALIALLAARGQVEQWVADGEDVARMFIVFNHPFAAAMLLALMVATSLPAPTPYTVKQLLGAVALVPIIVLARPVVKPAVVPVLYTVGVLFALDTLRQAFGGIPPIVDQAIVLVESLAGSVLLAWLLIRGRWPAVLGEKSRSDPRMLRRLLVGLLLGVLAIGLLASILGYARLARLTTPSVLVGAADVLWLYAAVEVANAVVAYAFRVWPLRHSYMVRHHRRLLEARIHHALVWMAVVGWWVRYLSYLGLWEPTLALGGDLLTARFQLGSFSTSPGDVLAFLATLLAAYLLSTVIRFMLQEEVYPRVGIAAGISYAASSVIHYAIVTIAFFVALGFLGVTLTQVTVLAGALGVGIGFGLQGVVNNFVSGLILLFERPINVGDVVQVGDLQGWVRRIGIRASIVRTVQGAEIIVPNAELTAQQVTNWTLSDQHRRLDLPVGLSYGVAPQTVIGLLEDTARAHPQVLQVPSPRCLFMGYGDSSINFELRVWTDYVNWIDVKSDLTVAIYDAVYAAGMSFPFPQREVRLLSDRPPNPEAPGDNPEKKAEQEQLGTDHGSPRV